MAAAARANFAVAADAAAGAAAVRLLLQWGAAVLPLFAAAA